jgi:intracellular multiplication protein IcmN
VKARFKLLMACLGLMILFMGCQSSWYPPFVDPDNLLPTRVKGASDAAVIDLMNALHVKSVKVVTIGQDYLVSIPAWTIFADQSPRLTWASYGTLETVIAFLKQFRKIAVTVTVYGTYYQSVHRTEALTRARAKAVANYLWSQGIDTRLMVASGAGLKCPIASCGPIGDRSPNSRVEITFRDQVA